MKIGNMPIVCTPLKQLMKETYFMSTEEVETMCQLASYIIPLQQFLNYVGATYTAYELNACQKFLMENAGKFSKVSWQALDRYETVLTLGDGELELNVMRGEVVAFSTVAHPATSNHKARLTKRI